MSRHIAVAIAVACAVCAGCDEKSDDKPTVPAEETKEARKAPEAPDHPAADRARAFLEALKYEDAHSASRLHVEASPKGVYCQNETFREVMDRARKKRSDKACGEVKTVSGPALGQVDDTARLLVQILAVVCENPDADCADYGARVLEANRSTWRQWARDVRDFRIVRAVSGRRGTIIYADIEYRGGRTDHRTLRMKQVDGEWFVDEALLPAADDTSSSRQVDGRPGELPDFD